MITVYEQEINDGISELVKANASIAYLSPVVKNDAELPTEFIDKMLSVASTKANRHIDRIDLYPLKTVLVTTGWNKNADVFYPEEVWAARFSAEDKPFNFMHQQKDIIGHITDNYVIDDCGNLIAMDLDQSNIPDKFHIITPSVIYRFWEDKAQQDRIERVIAEIERGNKWFVSMECLFKNFDYGLLSDDGQSRVIARNDKTAGLSKFLKQYGGSGKIDGGYSIGRVLRSITFSGKGLVDNPANPESVILNNVKTFKSVSTNLGYIDLTCSNTNNSKGKSIMAEKELSAATLNVNIEDNAAFKLIKSENESLKASVSELTKKLSETSTLATAEKITSLENEITTVKAKLTETETKLVKAEEDKNAAVTAKEKAEAAKDEAEKEADKLKKDKAKAERVSSLLKLNASEEEANKIVADFSDLSDEKFNSMATLLANKWAKSGSAEEAEKKTEEEYKKAGKAAKNDKEDDMKDMDKDGDCKAEKVIETAKAEKDANLGVTNVDKLESTRASINDWFNNKVRNRTKKD